MKYNELTLAANKKRNRVGRGIAAGQGKTAGRGTKGQKARTGKKLRAGFEGGQTPLMARLPKLAGFKSVKKPAQELYTGKLNNLPATVVTNHELADAGLIADPYQRTKLIIKGDVTKAVKLEIQHASAAAIAAVEKAGGSVKIVDRPQRAVTSKKKTDTAKAD